MSNRARRAACLAACIAVIGAASSTFAHPRGQRPVIVLARNSTGLDVTWVIAVDDLYALGESLALGPIDPSAFARQHAFQRYVSDLLTFTPSGRDPCTSEVRGVARVATGYATTVAVDCEGPVDQVTMSVQLLLDLSPNYVHLFRAETSSGPLNGATSVGEPLAVIHFAEAAAQPEDDVGTRGRLELFASGEGGLSLVVAVGFALFLGALHGIAPGHGKTLTAAYVVGAHGTLRTAGLLAGVVAIAHGASTFALAGLAAGVDQLAPQRLTPWLEGASALLAAAVGIMLLRAGRHHHHHGTGEPPPRPRLGQLVAIGIIGGLVPGPEAFAVSFIAVAVGKLALAAILIAAFSVGMALVVFGVAALAVVAGNRLPTTDRAEHLARRVGGIVFLAVAAWLAVRAFTAG